MDERFADYDQLSLDVETLDGEAPGERASGGEDSSNECPGVGKPDGESPCAEGKPGLALEGAENRDAEKPNPGRSPEDLRIEGLGGLALGSAAPETPEGILRAYFGYETFRPGQKELVGAILAGRDCVGVMPTGAGKSICYQVPALAFGTAAGEANDALDAAPEASMAGVRGLAGVPSAIGGAGAGVPGAESLAGAGALGATDGASQAGIPSAIGGASQPLTIVISPLVSLMHDQVRALVDVGVPASFLNSQLTPSQQGKVLDRARGGAYRLMYVAPERLFDPRFLAFAADAHIALVAVDEAHCVSQWGQDFRPSYLGIADFIAALPTRPVVAAFTATATPRVADDIVRLLELRDPVRVTTGFDRPNLRFSVEQLPDKRKLARVASWALEHPSESGIVYCSTRKDTEAVHEALVKAGVAATRYHAGLSNRERDENQRAFVMDDKPVMVATNAFGMGIDKSNVRYVIHYNMPGSLEAYYQEAGRAGRDGEPSECILFWNEGDIATCRFFIEQESTNEALTDEEKDVVRATQRRRLSMMANYCMTTDCLRATILHYFGEQVARDGGIAESTMLAASEGEGTPLSGEPPRGCGNCSNCDGEIDAIDVTATARAVMRCVQELRGRFGKGIVADVLRGSDTARIRQFGLTSKRTFGALGDSAARIKEVIELLTAGEYLAISEGRYPLVGFGPRYREAAEDDFRLYIKRAKGSRSTRGGIGGSGMWAVGKVRAGGTSGGVGPGVAGGSGEGSRAAVAGADAASAVRGLAAGSADAASAVRGLAAGSADAARSFGAGVASSAYVPQASDADLFERLRQLRKRLANEEGVPPYIVFSDATLRAMVADLPRTESEMLAISGVGPVKFARYGQAFLEELAR